MFPCEKLADAQSLSPNLSSTLKGIFRSYMYPKDEASTFLQGLRTKYLALGGKGKYAGY